MPEWRMNDDPFIRKSVEAAFVKYPETVFERPDGTEGRGPAGAHPAAPLK